MKNVAVVAVHGVGTHAPHATAEAVEHLLLRVAENPDAGRYTSFHEEAFDIPCHPLKPDTEPAGTTGALFDERLPRLRRSAAAPASSGGDSPDKRLMDGMLDAYAPTSADKVYESVRFIGQRLDGGKPQANVHIYEMFWSDISALGNSFWSVFGDLYQLVIHLPYIGLQTIDFAAHAESTPRRQWTGMRRLYLGALRAFTAFLPTFNLFMLALCLPGLLLLTLSARSQFWLVAIVAALGGMATILYRQLSSTEMVASWKRALPAVPLVVVGAAIVLLKGRITDVAVQRLVILECWITVAVILRHVLRRFNDNRPGVYRVGQVGFAALSLLLLYYSLGGGGAPTQLAAVMYAFEWAYVTQFLSWFVFAVCTSGVILLGWLPGKTDKLKRAAYTARLALVVPAFVFSAATTLLWGAIYYDVAAKLLPISETYESRFCYPALQLLLPADTTTATAAQPARPCNAVVSPASLGLAFEGAGASNLTLYSAETLAVAVLLLLFVVAPSVLVELRPSAIAPNAPQSKTLGGWLTSGFHLGSVAGELACFAIILASAATLLVLPRWPSLPEMRWVVALRDWLGAVPTSLQSLRLSGALFASGSAIGVVALTKRFTSLGLGLKPALASALDVDVYFRELPHDRTPRARMIGRYASLLRHLCHWRDSAQGTARGYDAIVIVAHSQGTVISADLLRYLQQSKLADPALGSLWDEATRKDGIPVLLLTLGCPLHQLYARRFPDLYDWVARGDFASASETPDPAGLRGVQRWVNLYTGGDYIGRALWRGERQDAYETRTPNRPRERWEACLGPGAHTHYLDATAEDVATRLDELIGSVTPRP